jgi:DNA-binding MarR family transcriptional regulator
MPPTTLSAVLKRLERPGDVRRRPNPADGRSVLLELTPAGRARMEAAAPSLRRAVAALDAALDAPVDELQEALQAYERAARRALDDSASS